MDWQQVFSVSDDVRRVQMSIPDWETVEHLMRSMSLDSISRLRRHSNAKVRQIADRLYTQKSKEAHMTVWRQAFEIEDPEPKIIASAAEPSITERGRSRGRYIVVYFHPETSKYTIERGNERGAYSEEEFDTVDDAKESYAASLANTPEYKEDVHFPEETP